MKHQNEKRKRGRKRPARLYTSAEVARILGVHRFTITRWIESGEIRTPRHMAFTNGITWLWDLKEVARAESETRKLVKNIGK